MWNGWFSHREDSYNADKTGLCFALGPVLGIARLNDDVGHYTTVPPPEVNYYGIFSTPRSWKFKAGDQKVLEKGPVTEYILIQRRGVNEEAVRHQIAFIQSEGS